MWEDEEWCKKLADFFCKLVYSTGRAGTGPCGRERPPGDYQELQSIAIF